jgi:hypothetical protein
VNLLSLEVQRLALPSSFRRSYADFVCDLCRIHCVMYRKQTNEQVSESFSFDNLPANWNLMKDTSANFYCFRFFIVCRKILLTIAHVCRSVQVFLAVNAPYISADGYIAPKVRFDHPSRVSVCEQVVY